MEVFSNEVSAQSWDKVYKRGKTPWESSGLSEITRLQLSRYVIGTKLLEVGCGTGNDASMIVQSGFEYSGIDYSGESIRIAKARHPYPLAFENYDFLGLPLTPGYDVIYDKGFFHGLGGVRRRNQFVKKVATLLNPNGMWVTVCGSADDRRDDFVHGAIFLRDLINPAEIYFEVLEIVSAPYGLRDETHDFKAWYGVFRRR